MLGQAHVVRALTHALETGRLHHAYLFTGTRGVGKTTLARILAKCLNCAEGVGPEPCGVCEPCREIDAGRFADLLEVDAATNTRVEEMRELLDNSQYRPVSGRFKVYIIDEVHMLSRHAFNAMLKTLEEPPAHMKFILATTDPQKVPVTVLSRCLQFALKPMTVEQLVSRLDTILQAEQVPFDAGALELVARAAHGSVRDSLSLLDQAIAFGGGRVDQRQVGELLGVAAPDAVLDLASALARRAGGELVATLQSLIDAGHAAEVLLQDFARLMQRLALRQLAPASSSGQPDEAALAALLPGFDRAAVQLCWQVALAGRRDLVHAPDEAAGLTMAFLRMLAFLEAGPVDVGGAAGPGGPAPTAGGAGSPAGPARSAGGRPPVAAGGSASPPVPAASRPLPPAAAAGPSPGAPPTSASEWLALVDRLPAAGVALELARHCAWRGAEGSRLRLALAQGHGTLLTARERLQGLVADLVGPVQLEIVQEAPETQQAVVAPTAGSAASRDDQQRAQRQHEAEQAIAADPVVAALTGEWGGRLVPGSVRPRERADESPAPR